MIMIIKMTVIDKLEVSERRKMNNDITSYTTATTTTYLSIA